MDATLLLILEQSDRATVKERHGRMCIGMSAIVYRTHRTKDQTNPSKLLFTL